MVEPSERYDYQKVLNALEEAAKYPSDMPIEPLCVALYEWTILFKLLGKTLSMAFSDITEKVQIMRNHLKNYGSKISGIMSLIQLEISMDIHRLNGESNKDYTKNKDYFKYEAGARTVLRLMWFMDFVTYMMEELIKDTKLSLGKACKHAYKKALEPHHPFVVRTAAKAAWLVAPDRAKMYQLICGNKIVPESECLRICQLHIDAFAPVRSTLWAYYEKNKLKELP